MTAHYRIILVMIAVLVLTGCKVQQHIQQSRSQFDQAPFEVHPPEYDIVSEGEVSGDIRLVVAAIIEKMRKKTNPFQNVHFEKTGKHIIEEPDFDFQGFAVQSIVIQDHQVTELDKNAYRCRLDGYISFIDSVNRKTVNFFRTEYRMTQDGININKSATFTVNPYFPSTQAFIIEKDHLVHALDSAQGFPEFYSQVVTNAHKMIPTQEEIRQRKEIEEMSFFERLRNAPRIERQDNVMVIFVMDRITPDAEIDVVVSRRLHDRRSVVTPRYLDYDGWQVAAFGGSFAIDRDVFYTKVYYKPSPGVFPEGMDQVLVGLYTSEKNYEKLPEKTPPSLPAQEGPLAQGKKVLNPAENAEAILIQTRLAELGYYDMAIDGLWGPGSRGALEQFQRSSGLEASGWNLQTQRSLFEGTGR